MDKENQKPEQPVNPRASISSDPDPVADELNKEALKLLKEQDKSITDLDDASSKGYSHVMRSDGEGGFDLEIVQRVAKKQFKVKDKKEVVAL